MAVHDDAAGKRPARLGFRGDALDLRFRHARIMLDVQGRERARFVATQTCERHDRADVGPPSRQRIAFGGRVEDVRLDANREHQPPVIGGKKAISRAPAIGVSCLTCPRSIAARIVAASAKAAS